MQLVNKVSIVLAIALSSGATAFAGPEMMDVEAKFRAKIAKEKIRSGAQQRKMDDQERSMNEKPLDESHCGSQSIGNIDAGSRPGAAPREEFVFAPNAINIVGRGGCR